MNHPYKPGGKGSMIVRWNSERKAGINMTQSIGETAEIDVKKKQIKQKEETHWRGQTAGPKAARNRCIYFEKMENYTCDNPGKHEGERKH